MGSMASIIIPRKRQRLQNTSAPAERKPALTLDEFNGEQLRPSIPVYLPHNLTEDEFSRLLPSLGGIAPQNPDPAFTFPALHNWLLRLFKNFKLQNNESHPFHKHPYKLRELDVQSVDWFWRNRPGMEDKLGFMKIQAKIETDSYLHEETGNEGIDWIPGAVFLRGGSVAILIIVQPADAKGEDEKYTVLTVQPRVAIGSLAFTEIPAGMIDGSGSFKGTAAAEIEEEAKLTVKENDLLNLSELAFGEEAEVQPSPFHQTGEESAKVAPDLIERQKALFQPTESLESAIYPSPGACDEFMPFFLCQKRLTHQHMDWLKGKATGLRDEGEKITLKVVPLSKMWREAGKDAKALVALSLYENMKREGRIPDMPDEVEREPVELGGQGA